MIAPARLAERGQPDLHLAVLRDAKVGVKIQGAAPVIAGQPGVAGEVVGGSASPGYPAPRVSPAERGGQQTVKLGQLFCPPGERGYVRRDRPPRFPAARRLPVPQRETPGRARALSRLASAARIR